MKKIKQHFNMLEVLIAVAVAGVGMTLLLVMFPIALKGARETTANNYLPMAASSVIAQLNASLDATAKTSSTARKNWIDNKFSDYGSGEDIPAVQNYQPFIENKDLPSGYELAYAGANSSNPWLEPLSIYKYKDGYVAIFKSYVTDNGDNDNSPAAFGYLNADFACQIKVERQDPADVKYGSSNVGDFAVFSDGRTDSGIPGPTIASSDFTKSIEDHYSRFIVTVSWPLAAAPASRQERVYFVEKYLAD